MISAIDRVRIAAHITANPRTVLRVYQGGGSEYSRRRVAEAARELGLPEPTQRTRHEAAGGYTASSSS